MKSRIDVRVFAVNKAVEIMGAGVAAGAIVAKAQEIEKYIIGDAVLPEVTEETSPIDYLNTVASMLNANASDNVVASAVTKKAK